MRRDEATTELARSDITAFDTNNVPAVGQEALKRKGAAGLASVL